MKKTIIKRILVFIIVFLMIISTPFSIYGNLYNNNNIYVYASTATFEQMLNTELMKHFIIATGISAGLVFATVEAEWAYTEAFKTYLNIIGPSYRPDGPDGPDLEQLIKAALIGSVVWSAGKQVYKLGMWLDDAFWELVKSFVDENYDVGDNNINNELFISNDTFTYSLNVTYSGSYKLKTPKYTIDLIYIYYPDGNYYPSILINEQIATASGGSYGLNSTFSHSQVIFTLDSNNILKFTTKNEYNELNNKNYYLNSIPIQNNNPPLTINGYTGIVDNSNYDWNNDYTDTKVIPIPIEMDPYGNPKVDENGLYLPLIDVDEWLDVQPTEIPNLDPTGTPIPDIPPFPDIENPDNDENTTIFIYIGDILKKIAETLIGIGQDVKTIVMNTNQIVFGTSQPVFDPTTGQQIDPETGQPVEPEPEASTGDGIIGDGIDTNIPTDFEWGDFRHFLDIFFIFIYFIVILILILLKFLQIVFTGLPGIAPNTDLFTAYPEILAGVDYVKNLKVGGLTITVHQAFEFVFLIFFYIFIIKQIRKLYNAMVFEESAIPINHTKDMKLDYYDGNGKINQYGYIPYQIAAPNQNLLPYVEEKQKGNLNYAAKHPSEYQNIKITDYTEG